MSDLYGNRHDETYTYRKVDWGTLQDGEDLGNVTGGSVELSAYTDLKAQGTMSFKGREAPEQDSLVRVIYTFTDDHGVVSEPFIIGTFIVTYSTSTYTAEYQMGECVGLLVEGDADLVSVLKVLQDKVYGMPFTVNAGENPVNKAVTLIESLGLVVDVYEESSYTLANDHTFEADASYLTIVNWCLNAASYQAVMPTDRGKCSIKPYTDPDYRPIVARFANDDNSIMYPEVVVENDWQSTPNVVRAYYEDDSCAVYAVARNLSGSKASLDNRGGREATLYESVSELEGETASQKEANLSGYATKALIDNSGEIERVTVSHPYVGLKPFDGVRIDYADRTWQGNVQNTSINLSPSTKCDTQVRRFNSPDIEIGEEHGILWEVSE